MKSNKKILLSLSLLIVTQPLHSQSDYLANSLLAWFTAGKDAVTSDFALKVYATILAGVGTNIAISLADPGLYKLRKITNTLTPQEKQIDSTYNKQLLEIEETKFQLTAAKRQVLQDGFPKYKKNIERKIEALTATDMPEAEKQKAIAALQEKIKNNKAKLRDTTDSIFEQMLAQAEPIR